MRFLRLSCRQVRARLPEYNNGIVIGRKRNEITQHLAECAFCRAEKERLERLGNALTQSAPAVPPMSSQAAEALLVRVLAESQRSAPFLPNVWFRRRLVWLALSGGAAAAGLTLLFLHRAAPTIQTGQEVVSTTHRGSPLRPHFNDARPHLFVSPLVPKQPEARLAHSDRKPLLPKKAVRFALRPSESARVPLVRHLHRRRLRHPETYLAKQNQTPVRPPVRSEPNATQLLALAFPKPPETANPGPKSAFTPNSVATNAQTQSASRLFVTTRFLPPVVATVTQDSTDKPGYARVTAYEPTGTDTSGVSRTVTAELQGGRMTRACRMVAASARPSGPTLIVTVTEPDADGTTRPQGVPQ